MQVYFLYVNLHAYTFWKVTCQTDNSDDRQKIITGQHEVKEGLCVCVCSLFRTGFQSHVACLLKRQTQFSALAPTGWKTSEKLHNSDL